MDLSIDAEERLGQDHGIVQVRHDSKSSDIVGFDGPDDPCRPINWLLSKKLIHIAEYFHVSKVVAILGLRLCLLE